MRATLALCVRMHGPSIFILRRSLFAGTRADSLLAFSKIDRRACVRVWPKWRFAPVGWTPCVLRNGTRRNYAPNLLR
jgi:hypothetical protein